MADSAPVRAKLTPKTAGEAEDVEFTFNPSELTITAGTSWKQTPAKGKSSPKSEFTGTLPSTLTFDALFVDNWQGRDTDVESELGSLMKMAAPTTQSVGKNKPQPPILIFEWSMGSVVGDCHLKSATIKLQEFDQTGKTTRATATITLEQVTSDTKRQNPTSGGPAGNRAHVVGAGDSLASIAFREYDDAALWRGLADLNGIDDPMRLQVGRRLIVPPYADVAARS